MIHAASLGKRSQLLTIQRGLHQRNQYLKAKKYKADRSYRASGRNTFALELNYVTVL